MSTSLKLYCMKTHRLRKFIPSLSPIKQIYPSRNKTSLSSLPLPYNHITYHNNETANPLLKYHAKKSITYFPAFWSRKIRSQTSPNNAPKNFHHLRKSRGQGSKSLDKYRMCIKRKFVRFSQFVSRLCFRVIEEQRGHG